MTSSTQVALPKRASGGTAIEEQGMYHTLTAGTGLANGPAGDKDALSRRGAVLKRLQELPEDLATAQPAGVHARALCSADFAAASGLPCHLSM